MAKQKIVVKVTMKDEKKSRKALTIAAKVSGVDSVALVGPNKEHIALTGEGIDPVCLTYMLRKSIGHTEIVSVGVIEDKKPYEPVATPKKTKEALLIPESFQYPHPYPPYHAHLMHMQVVHEEPYNYCSIL
ncbi:heavy metal-associated isoprenylated plant protein 46-like [Bidens hawaiensis]|uniref:heavy metal-associated isoprenylated plant protein 46-like n=1 Tax=Bidens hawaiensis TaxID=980011 RepID=UPI00404AFF12